MKQLATFLLVSGVAVLTYGITRWLAFREFVTAEYGGEGDPRAFSECERALVVVSAGVVMVIVSGYLFGKAKPR